MKAAWPLLTQTISVSSYPGLSRPGKDQCRVYEELAMAPVHHELETGCRVRGGEWEKIRVQSKRRTNGKRTEEEKVTLAQHGDR